MKPLLIGIDVGTSALKAVLVSCEGNVLATSEQRYPLLYPAAGHVEQRAQDWWLALVAAVREVTRDINPDEVCALGLSTQGGTLQPVDAGGRELGPAISWMDTRASRQQAEVSAQIGAERMRDITGWGMCGGLNALQILWLRQNKSEVFTSAAQFLSVPGYLTLRLTGRAAVDWSSAGVEQLLDVETGCWSKPITELLEINEDQLADLVAADESVGTLTSEAAKALGLSTKTVVSAGGHDQYCAALGAGASGKRDRLIATGTAWAVVAVTDTPMTKDPSRAAVSRHVVPGLWGALLSMDNGGNSLEWLRGALKPVSGGELLPLEQLGRLAAGCPAGSDGLTFYPFFSGSEYPPGFAKAKAGFSGLSLAHDVGHMARAIMEGVACQAVWMLEALRPIPDMTLMLTGGASKSKVWTQMIADLAGRPLTLPSIPEAGCLGAAALAGTAAGLFPSAAEGAAQLSGCRRQVEPGADQARYREVLENYKGGASRMLPV
ncbi:MAG: FGGY family carbohydrate kinase [Eubacteriales bacterium]|nr:FGGY family carbohydrate kinase [Eubacteriales bacterium]